MTGEKSEGPEIFDVNDRVNWRPDKRPTGHPRQHPAGTYFVVAVMKVPKRDLKAVGHPQYVTIGHQRGVALRKQLKLTSRTHEWDFTVSGKYLSKVKLTR